MALNKYPIYHEIKNSFEKFNKLLEQSEKFANVYNSKLNDITSMNTSEETCVNKIERSISMKDKELDFFIEKEKISELFNEFETKIKSRSIDDAELNEEINNKIEFEKHKFKAEDIPIQDMRPSKLIKIFENKIVESKENIEKQPRRNIKSTNISESGMYNKPKPLMVVSRNETEYEISLKQLFKDYKEKNKKLKEKFNHLIVKMSRGNCQIFIYGKVSVGKSKIINSMLGKEIFESTIAHTTSCFVKISNSPDQHNYIEYRNKKHLIDQLDDLKNKIKEMSTVFSNDNNRLETNELLSVYLNIPDNKILTSNTEIIDCPGSANKESITSYIKDKALNANIFIFVLTSGITDDDEEFFQFQLEQSSSPIIFMLVNKWDQAYIDGEDCANNSKMEITKGLLEFLKNRLHIPETNAKKQIFFVSAEDMYRKRNIKNTNSIEMCDYKERCRQFEEFEHTLSKYINEFNESKFNQYKEELHKIDKSINEYSENFKTDFFKMSYFETILHVWPIYKQELQNSLNENALNIQNTHMDFDNNLNKLCEESKTLNRYKIDKVSANFDSFIKDANNNILKLTIDISNFIDKENKQYKNRTTIEKEKRDFSLKEMMKMDIELKHISENAWESFLRKFTDIFTFLKKKFEKYISGKDSDILKENQNQINSIIEWLKKYESNIMNSLSEYLQTSINEIIDELDQKINIYAEYLESIERLFQLKIH